MLKRLSTLFLLGILASDHLHAFKEPLSPTGRVSVYSPVGALRIYGKSANHTEVELISEAGKLPTDCCIILTPKDLFDASAASFSFFSDSTPREDSSLELYIPRHANIDHANIGVGSIEVKGCTHLTSLRVREGDITIDLTDVIEDLSRENMAADSPGGTFWVGAPRGTVTFIFPHEYLATKTTPPPRRTQRHLFFHRKNKIQFLCSERSSKKTKLRDGKQNNFLYSN